MNIILNTLKTLSSISIITAIMFVHIILACLVLACTTSLVHAQLYNLIDSAIYNSGIGAFHSYGKNSYNQRYVSALDSGINSHNVQNLQPSFQQLFPAGVVSSSTPYIDSLGWFVFPTRDGEIIAYNFNSHNVSKPVWSINIRSFLTPTTIVPIQYWPDYNSWSRSTPLLVPATSSHPDMLIMGNSHSGDVFALEKTTGRLLWTTRVEDHTEATLTASLSYIPELDLIVGGMSSNEELAYALLTLAFGDPTFTYTFRGSFFALDSTGTLKYKTYVVPAGYNGAAIWAGTISCETIYDSTGMNVHCYTATGNNYEISPEWSACQNNVTSVCGFTESTPCYMSGQQRCASLYDNPQNLFDSIIKFDARSGAILGSFKTDFYDPSNVFCQAVPNFPLCYAPPSDDYDFGSSPMLMDILSLNQHGIPTIQHLLGVGQKNGRFYIMNRDTFTVSSSTHLGAGSANGGDMWNGATDLSHFYAKITGAAGKSYPLINGTYITVGSIHKIDPVSGQIVAQWVHPVVETSNPELLYFWGALTVVNDVLVVTSASGYLFFLRTSDLSEIRRINLNAGSIWSGVSILGNRVCVLTGYTFGTPNAQVLTGNSGAFCLSLPSGGYGN